MISTLFVFDRELSQLGIKGTEFHLLSIPSGVNKEIVRSAEGDLDRDKITMGNEID